MKDIYVVTGGSSGIGKAVAEVIGKDRPDVTVVIAGRSQAKLDAAAEELKGKNVDVVKAVCDISEKASIDALLAKAAELGNFKALINSGGVAPPAESKLIYECDMKGVKLIIDAYYENYAKEGSTFINIASTAGYVYPLDENMKELFAKDEIEKFVEEAVKYCDENNDAYAVAKAYAINYVKANTVRFARKGARILSIAPGTIDTPMMDATKDTEFFQGILKTHPMGRMGTPYELAFAVEFFLSDKASYITGVDLMVDGGYMTTQMVRQL